MVKVSPTGVRILTKPRTKITANLLLAGIFFFTFSFLLILTSDNFFNAFTKAPIRLSFVLVWPLVLLQVSLIPANAKILAHSFSIHNPLPLGAGISFILVEPHLPSTANGIELASLASDSQVPHPLLIRIMFNLALRLALSLAGTVSLLLPVPTTT